MRTRNTFFRQHGNYHKNFIGALFNSLNAKVAII